MPRVRPEFASGLVRVPTAWGEAANDGRRGEHGAPVAGGGRRRGGDARRRDRATVARELPARPFLLGGSCCGHVGAVRELARRHGRIGVVWIDAHGDLNTPESSPSGNAWGMPLRMLIDAGDVAPEDVTLLGARNLDPPEAEFIAASRDPAGARRAARASTSRSTATWSARAISTSSCRSRAGPPSTSSRRFSPRLPRPAEPGSRARSLAERNEARSPRLGRALGL